LLLLAIPGKASYSSSLASFPKPFRKLPVLQLSGPTVAALANLAISTGVLPGRYAADGKPDPNGPLHLGLGWADDSCPAKVHLWQLEGRCLGLRLGGRPTLTIRADKLHVALREPRLEETTGDPIARIGVWLKTAWSKSLNLAADTVTKMSFSLAGKSLTVELKHAEISGNDVLLGLDLK
jgi:hypothetical protein